MNAPFPDPESGRISEFLEATLDGLTEGCQILDPNWRYLYVNEAAAAQGRSTKGQLVGRTMEECYPGISSTPLFATMVGVMEERVGVRIENEFQFPDGGTGWFELNIEPVPAGIVVLSVDVTARKSAEVSMQRRLARLAALRALDLVIASSLDQRVILNAALEQVLNTLEVGAASVLLVDLQTFTLELAAGRGFRGGEIRQTRLDPDGGIHSHVFLDQKLVVVPNLAQEGERFRRKTLLAKEGFVAYYAAPVTVRGESRGVLEVFDRENVQRDSEWLDFLETIAGQIGIGIDSATMFRNLQRSHLALTSAYSATIEGWSRALDLRDKETEGHTRRVTTMAVELAKEMGVPDEQVLHIRHGALLHDIGKMGVPDEILLKPGVLTEEEWVVMKRHPELAYDLLQPIEYLAPALDIPRYHHEKWDGTGYPKGLKGESIPFHARLFAVVDVWDALRSDRPYREGWSWERTRDHLLSQSGKHFDPRVVEHFAAFCRNGDEAFRS